MCYFYYFIQQNYNDNPVLRRMTKRLQLQFLVGYFKVKFNQILLLEIKDLQVYCYFYKNVSCLCFVYLNFRCEIKLHNCPEIKQYKSDNEYCLQIIYIKYYIISTTCQQIDTGLLHWIGLFYCELFDLELLVCTVGLIF